MRIFILVFHLLFVHVATIQTSLSQIRKPELRPSKMAGLREDFEGGVLYGIDEISLGLDDMWKASRHKSNKENLGLFTTKGLLVLPNNGNSQSSILGSLKFLGSIAYKDQSKVSFGGEVLEILGMVHTHPDPLGIGEHTPYVYKRFEWQWTKEKIGNFVIAYEGIYQAQPDLLTSKWIGYRQERTYQLIAAKYSDLDKKNLIMAEFEAVSGTKAH